MPLQPFQICVPDAEMTDLRRRIRDTQWPTGVRGAGWSMGMDLAYLRALADFWADEFDWRAVESRLNRFPQFVTDTLIGPIHFVQIRGRARSLTPIVLTHGWPSTFAELLEVGELLADSGFDVIIPSLPGYTFSPPPRELGTNVWSIAEAWVELMHSIGYDRFVAREWADAEGGYAHIQGTKPDTLGPALNDSPVGLAAWILDKVRTWSDCNGDVESRFSKSELLTTVSLYWFTQSMPSAIRLYWEGRRAPMRFGKGQRIETPTAFAHFPQELPVPPRSYVERGYNIVRWNELPRGGHFAAAEEPDLLADDIRSASTTFWAARPCDEDRDPESGA